MEKLIIFGAGDLGKDIAYNLGLFGGQYDLLGFADNDIAKAGSRVCGVPVFGIEFLSTFDEGKLNVVVAISSAAAKESVVKMLEPFDLKFPNLIAKNIIISQKVTMGHGNVLFPDSFIKHETAIGNFVTINAGCHVGHNVVIEDYATLSPHVKIGRTNSIRKGAFMGMGSCTRQDIEIGERAIVGGQAMVIGNVPPGKTAVGVPARIVK